MSPFASQPNAQASAAGSSGFRPAWVVFVLCMLIGFVAVGWRAKARADKTRERARLEALARAAALETQFNQAMTATEVLAVMLRQGNERDFQKVANDLFAARPGLGSLELQPGGVVADIVPKPGNERVIGFNVLRDPAYGPGATAALQSRSLTIAGPVKLYSGEPGFILRLPVFRGRDSFWGFVACSVRIPQLVSRSRLDELPRQGYHYALLVTGSPGQKQMTASLQGSVYLDEAVQFPLRVQNLNFNLLLQSKRGWYDIAAVLYEALGVLIVSGILCLLVNMVESRREIEAALSDANRKLLRESADRRQALEECLAAKDESAAALLDLKKTRSALEQVQPTVLELQGQLAATKSTQTKLESVEASLKMAEAKISELQARYEAEVEAAEQSARAREGELDQAQANLNQAQQSISELQSRLAAAARAEKQVASVAQKQREQDQATIAELQARLGAASPGAEVASEAISRKLKALEETNAELRERLSSVEQAEAQVQELTELLKEARAELKLARESNVELQSVPKPGTAPQSENSLNDPTPAAPPVSAGTALTGSSSPETEIPPQTVSLVNPPATPVAPEPPVERKSPKPAKRKKRTDTQMDLFGEPSAQTIPVDEAAEADQAVLEDKPNKVSSEMGIRIGSDPDAIFESVIEEEPEKKEHAKEDKPAKRYASNGPIDEDEFRKAVNEILPLFIEKDPGAKDCLKANRNIFRSAFNPEGYQEFEQAVKGADFTSALEILRKVARRHGISA